MAKIVELRDVLLAQKWPKSRVIDCIERKQKELALFIDKRYSERLFDPIKVLRNADKNEQGYGFAIMALCCLLIETMECYQNGLPTSDRGELERLKSSPINDTVPAEYRLDKDFEAIKSKQIFINFFNDVRHQEYFEGVVGEVFYREIRCGLLHQAQTKGGWRLIRSGPVWDPQHKSINRDRFSESLRQCFNVYLKQLQESKWNNAIWKSTAKKLWWLAATS